MPFHATMHATGRGLVSPFLASGPRTLTLVAASQGVCIMCLRRGGTKKTPYSWRRLVVIRFFEWTPRDKVTMSIPSADVAHVSYPCDLISRQLLLRLTVVLMQCCYRTRWWPSTYIMQSPAW